MERLVIHSSRQKRSSKSASTMKRLQTIRVPVHSGECPLCAANGHRVCFREINRRRFLYKWRGVFLWFRLVLKQTNENQTAGPSAAICRLAQCPIQRRDILLLKRAHPHPALPTS